MSLDIWSLDFDAEAALGSSKLQEQLSALFPDAEPLNNVSECRYLLPASAADAVHNSVHHRMGSAHALAPKPEVPEARPGVDTRVAGAPSATPSERPGVDHKKLTVQWKAMFADGPLAWLAGLQRRRVRVLTRHEHGVRGWCEGTLLLFDRHLDMLLADATEHSFSPLDGRWHARDAAQLLLRGDGIVSICPLNSDARSARDAIAALVAADAAQREGESMPGRCAADEAQPEESEIEEAGREGGRCGEGPRESTLGHSAIGAVAMELRTDPVDADRMELSDSDESNG